MTAASDLDLILIYDFPADAGESNGPRPLDPGLYYSRLTQRLIAALTAPTKAGKLYEVDMRLRPSGRKGPLATQFSAFKLYQRERGGDLGAHGVDARPRRRRRREPRGGGRRTRARDPAAQARTRQKSPTTCARCAR